MTDLDVQTSAGASGSTRAARDRIDATLPHHDRGDFECARRGFVGTLDPMTIRDPDGQVVWDLSQYGFLDGEAPDTVHPALWRMGQLNMNHGVFTVVPGLHQARGFDISNMSIIEGKTGYIIVDPLTCVETARAALEAVRAHLGDRPVTAMIYSHSHIDHFGGARGLVTEDDVKSGRVPVVAPVGFYEHAVSENVHAGPAMRRRLEFHCGLRLTRGPQGHVSTGLGQSVPTGSISLLPPNRLVESTGTELTLDGVRFVFQLTPGAEAPAEMNFHLPDLRALCMAETVSHQMHNLYTLRGAQVRDALAWSEYLDEALRLFGGDSDVMFLSHHWPVWGSSALHEHISMHRDLYRYIHDETLRLANHGHTPVEIAEMVQLPPELDGFWANRGCYGSLNHNVKAVYQRYLGWFDGNPANLHPLPPTEAGRRYVELSGGRDAMLAHAHDAAERGEYRWAAELLKHSLAADPSDRDARTLQASVFEQLGYQAESGPWRDFYLLGAQELREGARPLAVTRTTNAELVAGMSSTMLLDFLAIRLNGPLAAQQPVHVFHLFVEDRDETFRVELARGLLRHVSVPTGAEGDGLTLTHPTLAALALGGIDLRSALDSGAVRVTGDPDPTLSVFDLFDVFSSHFEVTSPNPLRDPR